MINNNNNNRRRTFRPRPQKTISEEEMVIQILIMAVVSITAI